MGRECVAKGVCCIHLNSLSRLSPSKSPCTVYVAQFVPPRCHLIHHLPSHQSPTPSPVGPLQRANQRSLPERKTQKKVKRSSPMFMNRSTQFTKDRKTRASLSVPLWPIHTHPGKKEGGQSNCRLQISCDRFFIWDRINQISQLCPHVHHLPPIPLCRLHS